MVGRVEVPAAALTREEAAGLVRVFGLDVGRDASVIRRGITTRRTGRNETT
ncbi:hypothetical protein [Halapricum sp. CBA1109]|uniref:hypothetical protein n=1 Tax=Halapricum sp. CBA1109 TaxID=2668068 RepID=UPI0018D27254|nr:hypothetical protein [Halapricum sp. CBA1109]